MRERDHKKEDLIRKKALKLIVSKGFDGFSMQKLARLANVSPATLYIYYKNRQDLLNQLFIQVVDTFTRVALRNFDPRSPLGEGLWTQWINRLAFIEQYPDQYRFYEQFRNSPLINNCDERLFEFKDNMKKFVHNAVRSRELSPMSPELFWSLAYGPFYALVKFQMQEKTMMNKKYRITEPALKSLLGMVLDALKPKK